jgi:uncharacterized damage-inducible protein DinB
MRRVCIALIAVALSATMVSAQQQIDNVAAFARVYGVARWFYPSDAAAALDWNRFAVQSRGHCGRARARRSFIHRYRTLSIEGTMATSRKKAAKKRGQRAAGKKAAVTRKRRGAARKAATTRKARAGATKRAAISAKLLPEFEQEMATTRRLLERVPSDKGTWKPHQKSFSLGHLAQLVAWMPGWIAQTLRETELNLAGAGRYSQETTEALVKMFDENVRNARAAMAACSDEDYDVDWSLKFGERVVMTQPRVDVVRQHINHLVHHRGQLTVYLRLVDVPIPSIYGPTADERPTGF